MGGPGGSGSGLPSLQSRGRGSEAALPPQNRQEISVPGDRRVQRHLAAGAGFQTQACKAPSFKSFLPAGTEDHCVVRDMGVGRVRGL